MYKFLVLLMLIPSIALGQNVAPSEGSVDSFYIDFCDTNSVNDGDDNVDGWLNPGETIYIDTSEGAGSGTSDSMGVDTDGNGTVDNYLYSTTAGAFHIKKGSNVTLTVAGDTVTVAGTAGAGTADSLGIDTNGDGTVDNYLYSTTSMFAMIRESTGIILTVDTDTVYIEATLGTSIVSAEITDQTIVKDDMDTTASNFVFDDAYHVTSATADSEYASLRYARDAAGDSASSIESADIVDQTIIEDDIDTTNTDFVVGGIYKITSAVSDSEFVTQGSLYPVKDGETPSTNDIMYIDANDSITFAPAPGDADSLKGLPITPGGSSPTDNYVLKIDTDPTPDTFYWAADNAGSGVWVEGTDTLFAIDSDGDTVAAFWDDDAGNVRWQVATEDQTLRLLIDSLGIGGDLISELAGTGLTVTSNELTADLGTDITSSEIVDQTITGADMDSTGANFIFDDPFKGTSAVADSELATLEYAQSIAGDSASSIETGDIADQTIVKGDIDTTSANIPFDGAFHVTTAVADSEYASFRYARGVAGDSVAAIRDGDTYTGTHDYSDGAIVDVDSIETNILTVNDTLKIPTATAPNPATEGEIKYDSDDDLIEATDGSADFIIADRWKRFILIIDNPDGLTCDTLKIPIRGFAPGGIVIDSIGIMTSTSTTYEVDFEEWTDIDHSTGTESAIEEAITTSTSFEAAVGGVAHTVEYDNLIAIEIADTDDIDQLIVWIRYYMLGND